MDDGELRIVFCTVPDARVGEALARDLVEDRLAACVNLLPGLRSFYWWEGEIQDDAEALLVVKTDEGRLAELTRRIEKRHPYECPEVVALPIVGGSAAYMDWIRDCLADRG